jgi:site-specific DNA-methyltransferase (adenine-specific)
MWLYGSGFPKSLDVSKAIDKKLGVKRTEKKLVNRYHDGILRTEGKPGRCNIKIGGSVHSNHKSLPSTDLAKQWDGWGTALKPAYEPILFCRSPLDGTVVDTVLEYGAGAINIEGCRVEGGDTTTRHNSSSSYMTRKIGYKQPKQESYVTGSTLGRFPANVIHDGSDEVMELFPDVKSGGHGGYRKPQDKGFVHSASGTNPDSYFNEPSSGSAARFFYTAKASQSERSELTQDRNSHPTVKPLALMEYLLKLVTPPQGVILDPFMGSGTTLVAAQRLGFRCVGIELEERYCKIAAQRLAQLSLFPPQQQKETGT